MLPSVSDVGVVFGRVVAARDGTRDAMDGGERLTVQERMAGW